MSLSGLAALAADALKAASAPPPPKPEPARRLWLVTLPEGDRFSASCTPPATLLEMSGWYPGATIAPEDEPEAAPEDEGIDTWLAAMGDPPPRGQSLTAAPDFTTI